MYFFLFCTIVVLVATFFQVAVNITAKLTHYHRIVKICCSFFLDTSQSAKPVVHRFSVTAPSAN